MVARSCVSYSQGRRVGYGDRTRLLTSVANLSPGAYRCPSPNASGNEQRVALPDRTPPAGLQSPPLWRLVPQPHPHDAGIPPPAALRADLGRAPHHPAVAMITGEHCTQRPAASKGCCTTRAARRRVCPRGRRRLMGAGATGASALAVALAADDGDSAGGEEDEDDCSDQDDGSRGEAVAVGRWRRLVAGGGWCRGGSQEGYVGGQRFDQVDHAVAVLVVASRRTLVIRCCGEPVDHLSGRQIGI